MERLVFTNSLGVSVEFTIQSDYVLQSIDGTSGVGIDLQVDKSYSQDGETYNGNVLQPRYINVILTIIADDENDMAVKRRSLASVLSPKLGLGQITYRYGGVTRVIKALPERSPMFVAVKSGKEYLQETMLNFYCPNPYWQDVSEGKTEISTEIGNIEFPLEIPLEGLELSIRTINFITNIYNQGDVDTPIKVRLKATGTVINPIIEKLDTGEFIRVKRSLEIGDILEINTAFGNKRVEVIKPNGMRENVFHYIDYKSTFFSLEGGDNTIKYDAEVGENNLDVSIYYTPNYLGV